MTAMLHAAGSSNFQHNTFSGALNGHAQMPAVILALLGYPSLSNAICTIDFLKPQLTMRSDACSNACVDGSGVLQHGQAYVHDGFLLSSALCATKAVHQPLVHNLVRALKRSLRHPCLRIICVSPRQWVHLQHSPIVLRLSHNEHLMPLK